MHNSQTIRTLLSVITDCKEITKDKTENVKTLRCRTSADRHKNQMTTNCIEINY